jgi:DNA topoisomerase-3
MSKSVVLAEKPSVARDIAKVLNCHKKGNGFIEGKEYIVTWALGHLVTLKSPEMYDTKFKEWKLEDLPMLPEPLETMVIKKTGKQYNAVKSQLVRKDVDNIIIATDAGREGELVARWVIDKAHVKKPMKRLWISSVTDKAIREGFKHLKPGSQYDALYQAAKARSEADWYIGLNASRALTTKFNAQLNCGRVQTPTLNMIQKREETIHQFKPETYYGLELITDSAVFKWQDNKNRTSTFNESLVQKVKSKVDHKALDITTVDSKIKKSYAPSLYDLTELQRDANNRFGMSAKETLNTMQNLYERYKIVTYPRTDSKHLSNDIISTLPERLRACGIGEHRSAAAQILKSPIKTNKSFVDDKKVSDHHAIIPTEETVHLSELNDRERKIYDMIVKRFLGVLLPPHEYEEITVTGQIDGETFTAKGTRVIKEGFKKVFGESSSSQPLPKLTKGDTLKVTRCNVTTGETKPPKRFTEAGLLSAMENPSKYSDIKDAKMRKTLEKTGGLGTVATRADIIDKLFNSFLIEKNGAEIRMTSKGKQLLDLVPEELKSPATTAIWEQKLEQIAGGQLNRKVFIKEMKTHTQEITSEIKASDKKFKHDNITGKDCPECGKPLLEVKGKKGKMLVCQDRECGYKKNVARITNARCPKCKKKLTLSGSGDNQIFTCTCGYREKLSSFEKRKKKEQRGKVDRKTVKKYMNNDDEPINNQLAEKLKGLKLD